tara:strand:+ start:758 stop:1138 length:381 start_codon:yes stop_codon:yes gene_type:complete
LQIVFDRKFNLNRPFHFEIATSGPGILPQQVKSISCLENLLRHHRFTQACARIPPKSKASPNILYALDLIQSGLSQREIARRVFGEDAILTGWDGVSDHIRTKTRRIIKKGHRLVNAGYSTFFDSR